MGGMYGTSINVGPLTLSLSREGRGNLVPSVRKLLQCLNTLQPGPHSALRIVLMGCGIAEVHQQPIA